MSAYAYRRYRPPARYRYRPRRKGQDKTAVAVAALIVALVAAGGTKAATAARHGSAGSSRAAAAQAIAYARSELGKPYLWGGTGPGAFDCSGLAMMAYRSAGVSIARTTFDQWKTEPHVSSPRPGDLVFFAGSDGTMSSPGHVGIVIGGGKMIEAYATGYPVRVAGYGRPDLVGFTDPASLAVVTAAAVRGSVPGGSDLDTPAGWDRALLAALSDPQDSCDFNAVAAWERAEGGGFGNQASYDPLNLNPGPGARWPGHPAIGAWAFPDAATGLAYTVRTLDNGNYGAILAALRAGNSAQRVCDAIMASPWAASRYGGTLTASC